MAFSLRMGILTSISWRVALPAGALFAVFAFAPAPGSIKALADGSKADKKTELRGSASVAARQHSGGTVASAGRVGANHVAMGTRRAAEAGMGSGSIGLTGSRGSTGAYHIAMGTRRAAEAGIGAGSIGLTGSRGSTGAYHIAMGTRRAAEAGIGAGSIGLTGSRGSTGAYHVAMGTQRPPNFTRGLMPIGDTGVIFSRKSTVHSLTTGRTESRIRLASSTAAARADAGTSNQRLGVTSNR
jgi:hypothetical protein